MPINLKQWTKYIIKLKQIQLFKKLNLPIVGIYISVQILATSLYGALSLRKDCIFPTCLNQAGLLDFLQSKKCKQKRCVPMSRHVFQEITYLNKKEKHWKFICQIIQIITIRCKLVSDVKVFVCVQRNFRSHDTVHHELFPLAM